MATTYVPITTYTASGNPTTVTLSSIPSTYTDLVAVFVGQTSANGVLAMQFNGDTGTNYSYTIMGSTGAAAAKSNAASQPQLRLYVNPSGSTYPVFSKTEIQSYAGSTYKTVLSHWSGDQNGSGDVDKIVGLWSSTSAINSISFSFFANTLNNGSTITLYGILRA